MKKAVDITGQRFGKAVAIRQVPRKMLPEVTDTSAVWKCMCDCGTVFLTRRSLLREGRTRSCGCLAAENCRIVMKKKRPPGVVSALRRKWRAYKHNAEKRNLPFRVSVEEFGKLIISDCHYCGQSPDQITCIYRSKDAENTLIHNGIDRIDNSLGYVDGNMVPCCKLCNWFKSNMSVEDFRNYIVRAYTHLSRRGLL